MHAWTYHTNVSNERIILFRFPSVSRLSRKNRVKGPRVQEERNKRANTSMQRANIRESRVCSGCFHRFVPDSRIELTPRLVDLRCFPVMHGYACCQNRKYFAIIPRTSRPTRGYPRLRVMEVYAAFTRGVMVILFPDARIQKHINLFEIFSTYFVSLCDI